MKMLCVTMLLGLLLFAGCDMAIDKTKIDNGVAQAERLQSMANDLQGVVSIMTKAYSDANLINPEDVKKIQAIQQAAKNVQAELANALAAIKTNTYDPANDNVETALDVAISASSAFASKYAYAIAVTLALIKLLYGWFKKSKALTEVVMGNETFKKLTADMPIVLAKFKEAQTLTQSESTSKEVKAITA